MFIYKIYHVPTGLFYCSRKGRFSEDITNLSTKGNFYESEKIANKVLELDCNRASINRAQTDKYNLSITINGYAYSYNQATKEDFIIKKYELVEVN